MPAHISSSSSSVLFNARRAAYIDHSPIDNLSGESAARRKESTGETEMAEAPQTVRLGDELPPLRYRLLPTANFINVEFYEERKRLGMETANTVAVHCGYLKNTADKLEHLEIVQAQRILLHTSAQVGVASATPPERQAPAGDLNIAWRLEYR